MLFKVMRRIVPRSAFARFSLLPGLALLVAMGSWKVFAQNIGDMPSLRSKAPRTKALKVSPGSLNFGTLKPFENSSAKTVTIKNPNSIALAITSIASSDPQFVATQNCVGTIAAKGSCSVSVTFRPLLDGKKSAKLTIDNNGPKTLSIGLKGTGKGNAVATATATATATPTPTTTATPTPTATPTAAACPNPSPGACPSSGAPSATSLIPSSAIAGGPDIPFAICGCNLTSSTTVRWNGVGQSTQFISSNQINSNISAADLSNVGVDNVTVSAGSQVSSPQTFFVGSSGGNGYAELEIDQQANDIVNDPLNQVIYISVPGAAATNGNTISVVDLASGQITSSQFAGSNPDVLAISDDSQFLYAGIDGAASVQRFILPSLTNDISIPLGRSQFDGPYYALDIQVAPGAPHTTALTLANFGFSPSAD